MGAELVDFAARTIASGAVAAVALTGDPVTAAAFSIATTAVEVVARYGIGKAFGIAQDESGLTAEQLVAQLSTSADGLRLLARTVDAARTAAHDGKLQVLGRCLANGAQDDAKIPVELLLVAAVAAMEPYHLRLLHALSKPNPADEDDADPEVWTPAELAIADPTLTPDISGVLIGPVLAQGVVETSSAGLFGGTDTVFSGTALRLTTLGRLLLERSLEASTEAP